MSLKKNKDESMSNCCNVTNNKRYYKAETKAGNKWTPAYIEHVDADKCSGCGMCTKVCSRGVYEIQKNDGRNIAVPINADNCVGDGSCHMVCKTNAIVCMPKKKVTRHK